MITEQKLQELKEKYGEEKVNETVEYLKYRVGAKPMKKEEEKGPPIIYVFRHGQTTDNADMIFSGWRDVDLTELGVEQALELADKLKDVKFDLLITSDLIRAKRTMELAMSKNESAKNLTIIEEPSIKERSYGDWEGISKLEKLLEEPSAKENRRRIDFTPPNGESMLDVRDRVFDLLDDLVPEIINYKMTVAISCHGNSIRAIRQRFEGLDDYEMSHVETSLGQDYGAYHLE